MLISESSNNESFTERSLDSRISGDTLLDTDPAWFQFLVDHRQELRNNSTIVPVDESIMTRYKYRIRDFLEEKQLHKSPLELAFRVANRFTCNTDFNLKVTVVYVPEIQYVKSLRNKFTTWKNKYIKL